jgi:photosystem II stability/assembly factor-like uncharacterized protein
MTLHHRFCLTIAALCAIAISQFAASQTWGADEPTREQQILDTEKQIQLLNKKLEDLRQAKSKYSVASAGTLSPDWIKTMTWRCIGPAAMSGRIIAISVNENDPSTFWIATASGGLLKTVNNGVTFQHQFDHEGTISIGDVCVAPSDPNIVWVGTGENNPRNSVSYGDGVYKSTDGGKTWKNMGLKKSFQIGRVVVHPKNPNIVYVGALGRLYGPNEERGLFKTTNGGETWDKILYVDDRTGVIEMRMHPTDPETLLVATYERQRDLFDTNDPSKKWGPGSGLYKTTDGGKSFKKITNGLPSCTLGRIGIDYYRKNPQVVFAVVESEMIGKGPARAETKDVDMGLAGEDAVGNAGATVLWVIERTAAEKAGLKAGDVIVSIGEKAIHSYQDVQDEVKTKKINDKVKLKVQRGGQVVEVDLTFTPRPAPPQGMRGGGGPGGQRGGAGGGQPGQRAEAAVGPPPAQPGERGPEADRPYGAALGGQPENIQNRQGKDGSQYGGIYKSTDGGESWSRINSLNPRPMYFSHIRVDPSDEKYVYVLGIGMFRSEDGGKTFQGDAGRDVHADGHALWIDPRDGRHMIAGCDGGFYVTYDRTANWDHLNHLAIGQFYHAALDTRQRYMVYGGLQDNGTWGGPSRTRGFTGPINEDWVNVGGGDGFRCQVDPNDPDLIYWESQNGGFNRRNLRTGEMASIRPQPQKGQTFHFNWNSPFILSHHNSRIYYCGGNYVFRSLDRGNDARIISPEITASSKGSATALAESPRNPNVLYVGTDDGNLWVTRTGGSEWTNITKNVGLPGPRYVATIEPSRFEDGRAYVAFDGHRSDDDNPLVYVTEDFGQNWKSLRGNLPWGSTHCIREDLENANLLFAGTEFAAWASLDRGATWTKVNNNLPTVAVFDFALHPTAGEMVAATHGRSLWILDITPLRQMTADVLKAQVHLFKPIAAVRWQMEPPHGRTNRRYVGENPPLGAEVYYLLQKKADKISLKVVDFEGKTVRDLLASGDAGLHRIVWDLARTPNRPAGAGRSGPGAQAGSGQQSGGGEQGGAGPRGGGAAQAAGGGRRGGAGAESAAGTGGPGQGRGRRGPIGPPAAPGMYRVVLTVDGQEMTQALRVDADPATTTNLIAP